MIVLDTHIWVWWVHGDARLSDAASRTITAHEPSGIVVSAISCWEIAKLVEVGRLELPHPVGTWLSLAFGYPGVRVMELTPEIAVGSTQLPTGFHRDPADQIIVATARALDIPLLTADAKILGYPHVKKAV